MESVIMCAIPVLALVLFFRIFKGVIKVALWLGMIYLVYRIMLMAGLFAMIPMPVFFLW